MFIFYFGKKKNISIPGAFGHALSDIFPAASLLFGRNHQHSAEQVNRLCVVVRIMLGPIHELLLKLYGIIILNFKMEMCFFISLFLLLTFACNLQLAPFDWIYLLPT